MTTGDMHINCLKKISFILSTLMVVQQVQLVERKGDQHPIIVVIVERDLSKQFLETVDDSIKKPEIRRKDFDIYARFGKACELLGLNREVISELAKFPLPDIFLLQPNWERGSTRKLVSEDEISIRHYRISIEDFA